MKENKDCLACGESFSEEAEAEECDKLYCVLKQKYVKENEICENFN